MACEIELLTPRDMNTNPQEGEQQTQDEEGIMLPHRAIELGGRMWVAHRQKDNFRERLTTSLSGMDILPPRLVSESGRMGGWEDGTAPLSG